MMYLSFNQIHPAYFKIILLKIQDKSFLISQEFIEDQLRSEKNSNEYIFSCYSNIFLVLNQVFLIDNNSDICSLLVFVCCSLFCNGVSNIFQVRILFFQIIKNNYQVNLWTNIRDMWSNGGWRILVEKN